MERPHAGGAGDGGVVVSYPQHYPPQQQQQQQQQYAMGVRSRSGSRRGSLEDDDPEARIAQIKAQKEKERDRENALKEEQVSHDLRYT